MIDDSFDVLVSVGTDHHPFDRIVDWVDTWLAARSVDEDPVRILVQHGTSIAPRRAVGRLLLDHDELQQTMGSVRVVICHGGPATITEARRHGHRPICVPRDPTLGEHVDDHQQRFVRRLAADGLVTVAATYDEFADLLDAALAEPHGLPSGTGSAPSARDVAPGVVKIGEVVDALVSARREDSQQAGRRAANRPSTEGRRITVLYLGGLGRSGSTLLERAVGQLDGVANVGELVHLWERGLRDDELCGCGERFHACPFWTSVGERAFGGWQSFDPDAAVRLRYQVDRNRYAPLLLAPWLSAGFQARHRTYARRLAKLYRAIADVSGTDTIIDSSKHASYALLLRDVPGIDLRVLHVVRDSPAVAHSWSKQVLRPEVVSRDDWMPVYGPIKSATYWDIQNGMFEVIRKVGVTTALLRYEDFVAAPKDALLGVLRLLGRDDDPSLLSFLDGDSIDLHPTHTVAGNPMRFVSGRVDVRADDRWRAEMSPGRQRAVEMLTMPLRWRYGYGRQP